MDDLLTEFIAETRETMEALAGEVVAWEAAPGDRERLDAIFRFVHTVKGSCGFLDLPRLGKLSHAAEDVLADVRANRRMPDARLVSAVLGVIDRIGELTDAMETGVAVSHHEDEQLIAALAEQAGPADAPEGATPNTVQPSTARTMARSIRLPVDLLDRMMAGVSDLVLARNELGRKLRDGNDETGTEAAFERLSLTIGEIREAITRTRMARIDNLFSALPRLVRDLCADLGKRVSLDIDGGDVELDREMIEMIRDPLTHIVRNAIDHGIELPEVRERTGKPAAGRLRIGARQSGNQILIDVIDDGRGVDADRLLEKALMAGQVSTDQALQMNWQQKLELMFLPGLSTAGAVTAISGRGVGMDVVRANIERIGGLVDIESRVGAGLKLTLRVPLTLTIIPALTIQTGDQRFAVPRSAIEEIVRVGGNAVTMEKMGDANVARIRGRRLPVVALGAFMGLEGQGASRPIAGVLVVVRAGGGERFALLVDQVMDHEELVVKPAAPAIMAAGVFAGTTLPDNSRPMLLLDVAGIAAVAGVASAEREEERAEAAVVEVPPTLLFRDLDGVDRAIRLALVERIEDVPTASIAMSGGRLRMAQDGRIVAIATCGAPLPDDRVRLLRLSDGATQVGYAIDRVNDIVELAGDPVPAAAPGPVLGVLAHEGRPVELLDPFWLFAEPAASAPAASHHPAAKPLCLLADASDPWTRQVLGPLIAAAGYRVAFDADGEAPADVVIASWGASAPAGGGAPVVRIRPQAEPQGDDSIYRYDRAALLDALRTSVGGGR
ncbi:chemotaxis protein CheW [Sphingomonas naphthae]|uniref:histidine kinase n=1 Tax=Sphingomonas naphthae TaxID=1813468 RepID=A0ABY7TN05_9SPHN|nr:chemotaxis protein CheW [Sphingomonas naphthae]WCT74569.1 chemotaxis protein CheW [Sphingomonas naphthae]